MEQQLTEEDINVIDEVIKENTMTEPLDEALPKVLPESPMSIHIDTYYKGFHAGITIRMMDNSVIPVSNIMKSIDSLVASGFKPSWNEDTNKSQWVTPVITPTSQSIPQVVAQPAPVVSVQTPVAQPPPENLGVCKKCGAPNAWSKNNKVYCSNKCWL